MINKYSENKYVLLEKRLMTIVSFVVCLLSADGLYAQSVEASIDSIEIIIGEQAHLTLSVTAKDNADVIFPSFQHQQMITPGVEVLDMQQANPRPLDNGMTCFARTYSLTSFDDTLYYLPPLTVKVDGKEIKSKSLALKVVGMEVDTTRVDKFFGPKDVQDNPFLWMEWGAIFWLSVVMLLLLAVSYYLYIRLRDNKPIIARIKIVKRLLPHQKAMKEINEIKAEGLAGKDNSTKEYYTKLTDTLRKYIEERYGFSAMEMTSSEIIERLTSSEDKTALDELRQLFQTADLVKFAKYSTLINENDMNLVNAIGFINQTKLENQPTEEIVKPQLTEEEKRSEKTRSILKTSICVIILVCAIMLGYIVYSVCQLM